MNCSVPGGPWRAAVFPPGALFRIKFRDRFLDGIFMDFERFWSTFERFLDHFFVFCGNREYVKTSTACARELDFQGLEGFGSVYFCYSVSRWLLDGFLVDFGTKLGGKLGSSWH